MSDISISGACISFAGVLPDQFALQIQSFTIALKCQVLRREPGEYGVRFVPGEGLGAVTRDPAVGRPAR